MAGVLRGLTLTAMDLPGHGRAPDWDGVSDLHALATASATALAAALGQGGPIDLLGHSFGGTVALRIALTRPDLVRSLTLFEPVFFAAARADPSFAAFTLRQAEVTRLVDHGDRLGALRLFHADWGAGDALETLPERIQSYMRDRMPLVTALNGVLGEDAAHMLRPGGLEAVAVPVLLVGGSASPPITGAIHRALMQRLPQAKAVSMPGLGHMAPVTHASTLAPAVQDHLARS
jgi:pimeloyl-ACP methyl ester carboxylesterase